MWHSRLAKNHFSYADILPTQPSMGDGMERENVESSRSKANRCRNAWKQQRRCKSDVKCKCSRTFCQVRNWQSLPRSIIGRSKNCKYFTCALWLRERIRQILGYPSRVICLWYPRRKRRITHALRPSANSGNRKETTVVKVLSGLWNILWYRYLKP